MMCMNSSTKGTWLACDVIHALLASYDTHTYCTTGIYIHMALFCFRWTTGIPVCIGIVCILKQNTVLQNTSNRLQLFLTAKIAVSDLQSISSPWNQHFFLPYYIIRESERDVRARVIVRIQLYTKRESSSSNNSTNNTNNISGAIGDFHFTIHLYFLVCRIPI